MPADSSPESGLLKQLTTLVKSQREKYQRYTAIPGAQPRPRFNPPSTDSSGSIKADSNMNESHTASREAESSSAYISVANPVRVGFMLTVGVGVALLAWYILTNVGALSGWIVGAMFIALGLDPAVRQLEKRGLPRIASVITVVAVLALVVVGLLSWVIPKIANQTVQFINNFPQEFDQFLNSEFFTSLDRQWGIRQAVDQGMNNLTGQFKPDSNIVGGFLNNLVNAGSAVANIITGTLIVLILSLYFLASLPLMKAWFVRLTPASRRQRVSTLTEKITQSVGNYVMGQAIVALLNGTFACIVMLIVGVPFPQLLTLFVVILAFIPLIGGVCAGILVTLVALMSGWREAAGFGIPYLIYLQVEAYFISPRIMSKAVAVPGGIAIIAVAAGGSLWGVLGALIAIPVAASLLILVQEVLVPRQDQH